MLTSGRRDPRDPVYAFVPALVRRALGEPGVTPIVSLDLLAECRHRLLGPLVAVHWPGTAALTGVLHAVRRQGAVLVVYFPEQMTEMSTAQRAALLDSVVALTEELHFDQPLALVETCKVPRGGWSAELLQRTILRAADTGFASLRIPLGEMSLRELDAFPAHIQIAGELGMGVEVELCHPAQADGWLASARETGCPIASIRGPGLGGKEMPALRVCTPPLPEVPSGSQVCVELDAFVLRALGRTVGPKAQRSLDDSMRRRGAAETISLILPRLSTFDEERRGRLEAFVHAEIDAACTALGASGVALELNAALAAVE